MIDSIAATKNVMANTDVSVTARTLSGRRVLSRQSFFTIGVVIALSWLLVVIGKQILENVAGLHSLSTRPYPYFQVTHALLLYVIIPIISVSGFVFYLSPCATLLLGWGKVRNAAEWVVFSFGLALILTICLSTLAKLILGPPLTMQTLLVLWLTVGSAAWLFLGFRISKGKALALPVMDRADVRRLMWMVGASLFGVAALLPKIFWENFNLDGIEAFEFGRSLTTQLLPYWEIQDGIFGFYHNFVLFAYPNHWFITLFGPIEAAVRLPFILYTIVLFAALILLIELGAARKLSVLEEAALLLGLVLYAVVQAYNTNYEPFFADLAEMAATDTLVIVLFLSACYSLWTGRTKWFWAFAMMTCLAGPGALLLFGAFAIVTFVIRPQDWQVQLKTLCALMLVWIVIGVVYEIVYNQLLLGGVNNQFSAKNMLKRLFPPTLTEFARLNALLIPSGLLPVVSFFALRPDDHKAKIAAGISLIYFIVLYLQSWTSLHQFTPVMVIPLVVFWRIYLSSSKQIQRWLLPGVAATTLICIFVSLPQHFEINQAIRKFGQATEYHIGDYEQSYETAARGGWSLSALLPEDYRLQYPEQPWGTDPYSWLYYASREKPTGTNINYIIQPSAEPSPSQTTPILTNQGISVYVRDFEVWRLDRERELPRVVVSPVYEPILRSTYGFFRAYVEQVQSEANLGK